jgi:hypothetical protein
MSGVWALLTHTRGDVHKIWRQQKATTYKRGQLAETKKREEGGQFLCWKQPRLQRWFFEGRLCVWHARGPRTHMCVVCVCCGIIGKKHSARISRRRAREGAHRQCRSPQKGGGGQKSRMAGGSIIGEKERALFGVEKERGGGQGNVTQRMKHTTSSLYNSLNFFFTAPSWPRAP